MSKWQIGIKGDDEVLQMLHGFKGMEEWHVHQEPPNFYVELEGPQSHKEALEKAQKLLEKANRKALLAAHRPLRPAELNGVTRQIVDDHTVHITVGDQCVVRSYETAEVTVNGILVASTAASSQATLEDLEEYFEDDAEVNEVIDDLLSSHDGDLYRVYEHIAIDLATNGQNPKLRYHKNNVAEGRNLIIKKLEWATEREISSFTTSIQPKRHAQNEPARFPMSELEARALMRRVVRSWLQRRKGIAEKTRSE